MFWLCVFGVTYRLLTYFRNVPEIGTLLAAKLLGLVLVSFFGLLLLSNVITALSTFFLARDLDLLVALERAEDGAVEWVSDAKIASYHTVWFELHEDLLRMLGREREEAP